MGKKKLELRKDEVEINTYTFKTTDESKDNVDDYLIHFPKKKSKILSK